MITLTDDAVSDARSSYKPSSGYFGGSLVCPLPRRPTIPKFSVWAAPSFRLLLPLALAQVGLWLFLQAGSCSLIFQRPSNGTINFDTLTTIAHPVPFGIASSRTYSSKSNFKNAQLRRLFPACCPASCIRSAYTSAALRHQSRRRLVFRVEASPTPTNRHHDRAYTPCAFRTGSVLLVARHREMGVRGPVQSARDQHHGPRCRRGRRARAELLRGVRQGREHCRRCTPGHGAEELLVGPQRYQHRPGGREHHHLAEGWQYVPAEACLPSP